MLELLDLDRKLSKSEYKERLPRLQRRLHQLQRCCWEGDVGSLVVFEGWEGSGKGSIVRKLTERLEPRGFDLHALVEPRTYELQLPWLGRFWMKLPRYGQMGIFNRSWYERVLGERVNGPQSEEERRRAFQDIVDFEQTLAKDRYAIVKLLLHIDRDEQARRFEALQKDELTAWRVQAEDWQHHEKYDQYLVAFEDLLEHTGHEWAPWTLVEATDKRWARIRVFETVVAALERALDRRGLEVPEAEPDTGSFDDADDEEDDGETGDAE